MRVDIRDVKAVGALRPLEVGAYLRAKGWTQKHATPGRETIWTSVAGGEEYEILLPLDQTTPDFSLKASPPVNRLERHAGKLARAVLRGGGDGDTASLPDPPLRSRFRQRLMPTVRFSFCHKA